MTLALTACTHRPLVYYTDQWSVAQPAGPITTLPAREELRRLMPRIVKHPELRRDELLSCARAVFLERGYDNASLNEVIAAAGVSKGAFYHYFSSKETLLEALAERFAKEALARIQHVVDDPGLDALERLNLFLATGRQNKIENATTAWALFESLFRQENVVLFHRINTAMGAVFSPILTEIIRQGVSEGMFKTFDPAGVADMILQLGTATHGMVARALAAGNVDQMNEAIHALERRVRLYEIALSRILDLPDESVRLTEPGYVRTVMTAHRRGVNGDGLTSPYKARPRKSSV